MKRFFMILAALAMFCAVGCEDEIQETPNPNGGGNEQEEQEPEPELPDVPPIENICEAMDDVEFIKYCTENFDINKDGILAASEIANVRYIDISNQKVYSIEGIAYFENLNELNARGSSLIGVDLRRNAKLTMVNFRECALLENAMLPDLAIIADSTFYACNRLAQCKVPSSVTQIGNGAFQGCSAMTDLSLGENVASIGKLAFEGCSGLATISMYATNISEEAFKGALGALTIKPNTKLCKTDIVAEAFTRSSIQSVTIVEGITEIGAKAFYGCSSLESVTIPSSVTEIGNSAFYNCGNLSIVVPSTVTTIGANAFMDCANVTFADTSCSLVYSASSKLSISASNFGANSIVSHTYNDGVGVITFDTAPTQIGNNTFKGKTSLTSITIPDSVTSIGEYAFNGCSNLVSITIPESVTSIGQEAFAFCTSLASVTIPDSVTSIGEYAFNGCSNLVSITIPESVTSIGKYAFYGCSSLTSITIPDSVTSIGSSAFYGCSSLTSITIPDSVTSIGEWAFYDCESFTSITIPEGVTSIEECAFRGCTSLASVTISENVTNIGKYAFRDCPLKEVYCKPTTPPAIYYYWWNSNDYGGIFTTYHTLKIYVPRNSYDEYTQYTSKKDNAYSEHNWSLYKNFIEPYDFE